MSQNKKAFTIIEVVLVLAIAGLIFLMVFIALPALQRSQRNTQRRNDLSRFMTAVEQYAGNNSNKSPFYHATGHGVDVTGAEKTRIANFVQRYIDQSCQIDSAEIETVGGLDKGIYRFKNCSDQFSDPAGETYGFDVRYANAPQNGVNTQDIVWYHADNGSYVTHLITVYSAAKCNQEENKVTFTGASGNSGKRQIAMFLRLEGGSSACVDNQ
jgi:prepilin-type N-terminal cleavage/methylation domain-containing protein